MPRRPGPLTVDGDPMFRDDGTQILRRNGKATRAYMKERRSDAAANDRLRGADGPKERAAAYWDDVRRLAKHAPDEEILWQQVERDLSMLVHRLKDFC